MFSQSNKEVRESVYAVLCQTAKGPNELSHSNGTAFMIAPGICVTAAHVLHLSGDKSKQHHQKIELIRSPEIGGIMKSAQIIAEDLERDLAIVQLNELDKGQPLALNTDIVPSGTTVGSLGFPLAKAVVNEKGIYFNALERFQAAHVSAFEQRRISNTAVIEFYETDSLMYAGSSGCPAYTIDGKVIAMHVATRGVGAEDSAQRIAISLWVPSRDILALLNRAINNSSIRQ